MKIIHSFLILIALLLFTSACQREPASEQYVDVCLQVKMDDATKAIGDGSSALKLICVAEHPTHDYWKKFEATRKADESSWTVNFRVLKGGSYNFYLWATSPDSKAYTIDPPGQDGITRILVDYNQMAINSNVDDAFYGVLLNQEVAEGFTAQVTLTRPLAQIGLYSKDSSVSLGNEDLGNPDRYVSSLTLTGPSGVGIPNRINLLDGSVDMNPTNRFEKVIFPDSPLQVLETSDTDGTTLAFAYVLAPADGLSLTQVDYSATLKTTTPVQSLASGSVSSVPLKRNFRSRLVLENRKEEQVPAPGIYFLGTLSSGSSFLYDTLDEKHDELWVSIKGANGTTVYYTLDGTTPTEESLKYEEPFSVREVCVVQAIAVQSGYPSSEVSSAANNKSVTVDKIVPQGYETLNSFTVQLDDNVYYGARNYSVDMNYLDVLWLQPNKNAVLGVGANRGFALIEVKLKGYFLQNLGPDRGDYSASETSEESTSTWTGHVSGNAVNFYSNPTAIGSGVYITGLTVKYTKEI